MKTNVTYLNQKYNVNPIKRAVNCLLVFGINLDKLPNIDWLVENEEFSRFIEMVIDNNCATLDIEHDLQGNQVRMLKFKTNGISYCAPEDKFSEELGKKIACSRAQHQAFEIASAFYGEISEMIGKVYDKYAELSINCKSSCQACTSHVRDLAQNPR